MRRLNNLSFPLGMLLLAAAPSLALNLQTPSLKRHDRFYAGSDKGFIGDPHNWSGVGRVLSTNQDQWAAMISPSFFISANHYHPANEVTLRFFHGNDPRGTYEDHTVLSGQHIGADLWLGRLSTPVSSAISKFPILSPTFGDSFFLARTLHVMGRSHNDNRSEVATTNMWMGLNRADNMDRGSSGDYYSWSSSPGHDVDDFAAFGTDIAMWADGGDSGAGSFAVFNGVPTLIGTHYYSGTASFVPSYISQINTAMVGSGELITVITPTSPPPAPVDFTALFVAGSGVQLRWRDVADTETGYVLERRVGAGAYAPLATLAANSTNHTDAGAVAGQSYSYRLRGYHAVNTSDWVVVTLMRSAHTLPYSESFEAFAPDTLLPGFEGWSGDFPAAVIVSTNAARLTGVRAYGNPVGLPLRATTHDRLAAFGGTVTNTLAAPSNSVLWLDQMLEVTRMNGAPPPIAATIQCAFCIDEAGHLNLWHRDLAGGSNRWSALDWQNTQTTQWLRVTLQFDYGTPDPVYNRRYFRLFIDGAAQSNILACTTNHGSGAFGGTWFAQAASDSPTTLRDLLFSGDGALDDLVVDTTRPLIGLGPHGTPEWWLVDEGLTNGNSLAANELEDADTDRYLNWQEFAAETDPHDPASLLCVTELAESENGRLPLTLQTIAGKRYTLESSTNLTLGAWEAAVYGLTPSDTPALQTVTAPGATLILYVETRGSARFYRVQTVP